jgi:ribulose-5-phosphate 4-epimerase/fuculose-1-phosphate aldolase
MSVSFLKPPTCGAAKAESPCMSDDRTLQAIADLVAANRILAHEGVFDALGHVSVRHPLNDQHFFLSQSKSPELVTADDIMEFELNGETAGSDPRPPYYERFIHAAVYASRPDVLSVVHSHANSVLPFSVSSIPLRPIMHSASEIGAFVPVWDIRKDFGDTNLLVSNISQGRSLAGTLGSAKVVLMRGHGFTAAAGSIQQAVMVAIYLPQNAQALMDAMRLGGDTTYLSEGEIALRADPNPESPGMRRLWEYLAHRASRGQA